MSIQTKSTIIKASSKLSTLLLVIIIIIIIILFVQNKMHIKHMNKISEQNNKALTSALTASRP